MKKALLLILLLLLVSGVVSSAAEANAGNSTVVTLDSEAEAIDLLNEGTRYAQANDYYNALEAYSNAIELNPGFAKAYFNRGLLLASRKRTRDRAIRDFNQAIELAPDFAEAYVGRGNVHDSYKARRGGKRLKSIRLTQLPTTIWPTAMTSTTTKTMPSTLTSNSFNMPIR